MSSPERTTYIPESTGSRVGLNSFSVPPRNSAVSIYALSRLATSDPRNLGDGVQEDDNISDSSSGGHDSVPNLISIADFEDERNQTREWHWDSDSDDSGSIPELEPNNNEDDGVRFAIWHPIPIDESLLDSDEEEEMRAYWAEMDLSVASDSSSNSSDSGYGLSDDEGEGVTGANGEGTPLVHPRRSRTEALHIHRSRASESFSPRLLIRRATSLGEAAYANVRVRLEDALDDRELVREWPLHIGELTTGWYQPIPLVDGPDLGLATILIQDRANTHPRDPRLHLDESNWH